MGKKENNKGPAISGLRSDGDIPRFPVVTT